MENFWRKQLRKEANAKFQTRRFLRPKIDNIIENRSILDKSVKPKSLVLARILLFCAVRIKFTYFPTAPLFYALILSTAFESLATLREALFL